jgi:hypothetical protein
MMAVLEGNKRLRLQYFIISTGIIIKFFGKFIKRKGK